MANHFDLGAEVQKETASHLRLLMIQDWEARGLLNPSCPGCKEFYDSPRLPSDVFAPRHKNSGCDSGGRPHCTCPTCWG